MVGGPGRRAAPASAPAVLAVLAALSAGGPGVPAAAAADSHEGTFVVVHGATLPGPGRFVLAVGEAAGRVLLDLCAPGGEPRLHAWPPGTGRVERRAVLPGGAGGGSADLVGIAVAGTGLAFTGEHADLGGGRAVVPLGGRGAFADPARGALDLVPLPDAQHGAVAGLPLC